MIGLFIVALAALIYGSITGSEAIWETGLIMMVGSGVINTVLGVVHRRRVRSVEREAEDSSLERQGLESEVPVEPDR